MQSVAILTTFHSQKEKTLAVLRSCFVQIDKMKNDENFSFTIYLLAEKDRDDIYDAVSEEFPQVKIIEGQSDGECNKELKDLWKYAAQESYEFYIILDSGILLNDGAFACLMENSRFLKNKAIIAGTISDKVGRHYIFGGLNKHGKVMTPDDILPLPCCTFDGKLVLVPADVYKAIGDIDPIFTYRFADYDYGRRAKKNGINVVVAPKILGSNDQDETVPIWRNAAYPLSCRFKSLNSRNGCPPKDKFIYDFRQSGLPGAIVRNISFWLKVLFPTRRTNK